MLSKPWFYTAGKTNKELTTEVDDDGVPVPKKQRGSSSSSSSAATINKTTTTKPAFLANFKTFSKKEFERKLKEEIEAHPKPRPSSRAGKRKRARAAKKTLLNSLVEMMEDAKEQLEEEESMMEEDDGEDVGGLGTTYEDDDGNWERVQCPTEHARMCCDPDCASIQPAKYTCYCCTMSYCLEHLSENQATDFVVVGATKDSFVGGVEGGDILCMECFDVMELSRVLNVGVIEKREKIETDPWDEGNEQQREILNDSRLQGSGRVLVTEEDIRVPYYPGQSSRPLAQEDSMPQTKYEVPDKKKVKKKRTSTTVRWTQVDEMELQCPGCGDSSGGDDGCQLSKTSCIKQYPHTNGWNELQKKREHLKHLLDMGEVDQAWNYILQHVSFEEHKDGNDVRIFKKMDEITEEERVQRNLQGYSCAFCSRAAGLNTAIVKPHKRRGKNVCGNEMYQKSLTYLCSNGARKKSTYKLPGPPGGISVPVSEPFLRRLFNVPERTFQRQVKAKREGRLSSNIQAANAKAGGGNRTTVLQKTRLEEIMTSYPQNTSHYASGDSQTLRFDSGVSRAVFWYDYAERWDPEFFNQCERLRHKYGFDESKARPSDQAYLDDAIAYSDEAEQARVQSNFDAREEVRSKIRQTQEEIETATALQDITKFNEGKDRKENLERDLKRLPGCHIRADVSYTTALRFYNLYNIKIGKIAADVCKRCEQLRLALSRAQSEKKKAECKAAYEEHLRMAKEGYEWRKQDRARAVAEDSKTHMMVIDFGQGLRTPTLSIGTAWYRRVLKVNPYIICSYGKNDTKNTTYFVWDETIAQKGADEVMSVVHQHILNHLNGAEHLIIHFDGCYGQANNHPFLCFCQELVEPTSPFYIESLERITLKRNPVGHTFCECDTCHGQTQKEVQKNGGQCHTVYKEDGAPDGVWSWQEMIELCGFTFVRIGQEDILDYTKYLIHSRDKEEKKLPSIYSSKGNCVNDKSWLHSKVHMFEIARWDIQGGPKREATQAVSRGVVRSLITWNDPDPCLVRIWRSRPKVVEDKLEEYREAMSEFLDDDTGLPLQKYDELFEICVLKKWDLWKNGQETGYGAFLIRVYPALTVEELEERTTKKEANKARANGDFLEGDDDDE
jgi:hypothetical protein